MISAIRYDNPVVYIDDRWLHDSEGIVPEEIIGKAVVRREGDDDLECISCGKRFEKKQEGLVESER